MSRARFAFRRPSTPWRLGFLYWSIAVVLALSPRLSGNVWSRYLTIESLVERGSLAVDQSPLLTSSGTPDLVMFNGRLYSDKPPVLSVFGAAVYEPLFVAGVTFSGSWAGLISVNWLLVAIFGAGSAAVTLVALRRLLATLTVSPSEANMLTWAFGYGSLLLPYAVTFNNHVVAAGLITSAFALVQLQRPASPSRWSSLGAGLLAGFAAVIDMPAGGAVLLGLGVWLSFRDGAFSWRYFAGATVPLLLHAALQSLVTGSPLPAELYPEAFLFPGSYWATPEAASRPIPRWQFALELLIGPAGWVTLTPVLLLGFVAIGSIATRRHDVLRPPAIVVAGITSIVILYYVALTRRTDFAGQSYGTRHLLALSPLIYFFSCTFVCGARIRGAKAIFALLTIVGVVYAMYGMSDPWTRVEWRAETPIRLLQRLVPYPWSSYSR